MITNLNTDEVERTNTIYEGSTRAAGAEPEAEHVTSSSRVTVSEVLGAGSGRVIIPTRRRGGMSVCVMVFPSFRILVFACMH